MNGDRIVGYGAFLAAMAVALGAFGAHGLRDVVEPEMLAVWETGVRYHFYHAVGLVGVGILVQQRVARGLRLAAWPGRAAVEPDLGPPARWLAIASWLFLSGIVLFSGSLYTMTLTGVRKLGAVTPIGGLCFLAGWAAIAWNAFKIID